MIFRPATRDDLPAVVALLTDDLLGARRESGRVDEAYLRAFDAIEADDRNELMVLDDGEIVGCLQLTYIPGLGRHGAERALVEAVRVRSDRRGNGLGGDLMRHAIEQARGRGCALVQLTSDKRRPDAHRFYRTLGFEASHEGFKLPL